MIQLDIHVHCTNTEPQTKVTIQDALRDPPDSPWLRGYKLLFNSRGIGTDWELPYLWSDSTSPPTGKPIQDQAKDRGHPSRWTGIIHRFGYLILNYILLCIYYNYLDLAGYVRLRPADTLPSKEGILRRAILQLIEPIHTSPITKRELVVRIWAVSDLIIPDYLILSAYHDFFGIFFIATGLDEPWEWPPLFGPITEAYSMRRYWSIFWHRLIYKSFTAHAAALLSFFRVRRGTMASRLMQNFLVFFFSAGMHGLVSWRLGNRCGFGKNLVFWLLQPLAFLVEGIAVSSWKKIRTYMLLYVPQLPLSIFERMIGYMWVVAWLFWCVPKGRFPMLFCGQK